MGSGDYKKILDAMQAAGIYVIREDDHRILYLNQRVREVTPQAREGMVCHELWPDNCGSCPLLAMGDRRESRSVFYNSPFGQVVDITATRIDWEENQPAFIIMLMPHTEVYSSPYHRLIRVDLVRGSYDAVQLGQQDESWACTRAGETLDVWIERFVRNGRLHPEDVDRLRAFVRLDHLRKGLLSGKKVMTCTYRRWGRGGFRWNLLEVVPDSVDSGGNPRALLYAKDVHDVLREGLEREEHSLRSRELVRGLSKQNSSIYTINLTTGGAEPVRVDGQMCSDVCPIESPWEGLMRPHITARLHRAYLEDFDRRFSLEGLRRAAAEGRQKVALLCQWRSGETYRYISITAHFGSREGGYVVLSLQDIDGRVRRELAHTKRDMQMAAILKSRYQMMTTVYLESGLCERVDLTRPAGPENALTGDYDQYIQRAAAGHVHPEDAERFRSMLSLEHLREIAECVRDHGEEVCQYRLKGETERWVEMHVYYSRQEGEVTVNLLGQDITEEKKEEDARLQSLEDQAYMITSLSSMFFSTYYMDVERDTFRAVTQQRRVGELLGDEVNCTAALELYANYFIHPEDREKYLSIMNMSYLR